MTTIEWTEATWNPITGCTRVSAGCDHCYAVAKSHRLAGLGQRKKYGGLTVLNRNGDRHFNGVVRCHEDALSSRRYRSNQRDDSDANQAGSDSTEAHEGMAYACEHGVRGTRERVEVGESVQHS